jgi:transcriptional regulator with XRE-family HTH domain
MERSKMTCYRQKPGPSGADLKAARKAGGLPQAALGAKAGISRHAVSYWECRATVDPRSWAVKRMADAEPRINALLQDWATNTRGRGMGLILKRILPGYSAPKARAREGAYRPSPLEALLGSGPIDHSLAA